MILRDPIGYRASGFDRYMTHAADPTAASRCEVSMKPLIMTVLACGVAACGSISEQMAIQGNACAARGGTLTAMGCQGGGGGLPGRVDRAPATDRYGQPNYDERGQYVGAHGVGSLVDRPPPAAPDPTPTPTNLVCIRAAAGNAASCSSP